MYIFPLISRELHVAQRRRSTLRLRMGFGAGTMLFVAWAFLAWRGVWGKAGPIIFAVLAGVGVVGSCLAALLLASDSVSHEKREGTLGFLFLTDLRASEIVIGKLVAAAVVPLFTLMAMFPSFAVCLLSGGVTSGQFWRVMLGLLVALIGALAGTLFVSSYCVQRRSAYAGAAALLCLANPGWLIYFASQAQTFWLVLALALAAIVVLLWRASAKVESSWRDKELSVTKPPSESKATAKMPRKSLRGTGHRNPIVWLITRSRNPATSLWGVGWGLATTVVLWMTTMGTASWSKTRTSEAMFVGIFVVAHLIVKVVLLSKTSHQLFADRQDGNLELLLATPLGTEEIFAGFQAALQAQFSPAILFIMVCDMVAALLFFMQQSVAGFAAAACCILLWPEFISLIWTGVWRILMANHAAAGLLTSAVRVVVAPTIIAGLMLVVFHNGKPIEIAFLWVAGNLAASGFFFIHAKAALLKHGRTLLLRPYGEKTPEIQSEWSAMNWEEEWDTRPVNSGKVEFSPAN